MTLLERFDSHALGNVVPHKDEIRRALAIAQVVQSYADRQEMRGSHIYAIQFLDEADELLEGK